MKRIVGSLFGGGGESYRREQEYVAPYLYLGFAKSTATTAENVWHITRVEVFLDGTVDVKTAVDVSWDNRFIVIYT